MRVKDEREEATKFSGIQFRWLLVPSNSSHCSSFPIFLFIFFTFQSYLRACPRGNVCAKYEPMGTLKLTETQWRYRTPWARYYFLNIMVSNMFPGVYTHHVQEEELQHSKRRGGGLPRARKKSQWWRGRRRCQRHLWAVRRLSFHQVFKVEDRKRDNWWNIIS